MHNKFFIMDGGKVWTGSTNISDTGMGCYNANIACAVESETIVEWYIREFEQLNNKPMKVPILSKIFQSRASPKNTLWESAYTFFFGTTLPQVDDG